MRLLAVGVATALVYALWVTWVPLLPDNLYVPLLDLGKITGYHWASAAIYMSIVIVLYSLYAYGYRLIRKTESQISTRTVLVGGAIFCAELIWAYPATAVDVFGYVAHGELLAVHHVNPFMVVPNAFPNDPIIPFLAFPDEASQYGPIWVLIGGGFASLARASLVTQILLYKLVATAAHVAGAAVIYRIAASLTRDPKLALASAYLYVWNPMLLWEMMANAHNDGVMMFFGLIGVWLFVAGKDRLVLAAVAAGALVKAPVGLIAPALLIGLWKRGWARTVEGALLALALVAVVYRPFWEGVDTLTALRRADLFTASFGSVLRLALEPVLGEDVATSAARSLSLSGFAVVAVLALFFAARSNSPAGVLRPAYYTLLAALLLATTWFQAWYVVWPLALGAALAEPRRHLEVALLSLGGLLQYFVFIYLWVMGYFPQGENLGVQAAAYLAIVGPWVIGMRLPLGRGNADCAAGAHGRIALCR